MNLLSLLKRKLAKSLNCIVLLIAIICILIAVFAKLKETPNDICFTILVSVGTSMLATALVSFISMANIAEKEQLSNMVNKWNICGIYKQRSEINVETNTLLSRTKNLDICAMGLKNFRSAQGNAIKKYVKKGLNIRIITIDPNSIIVDYVDNNEHQTSGHTKDTIQSLIQWVSEIKKYLKNECQVHIRVLDFYPSDFYFAMDGTVWTGPYQAKESQQTLTYKYDKGGMGADYYTEYFEELWENATEI